MFALATLQTAVFDIAHLFWDATCQHLGHQAIVVRRLVAWMGVLKRVPVDGREPGHEKAAAVELGTSEITIKMHRGQTMRKMRTESFAELVRMAETLAVPATWY